MPAAHAVLGRRLLVGGGKPPRVGEELGEGGPDRLARLLRRGRAGDRLAGAGDEAADGRRVEDELVHRAQV